MESTINVERAKFTPQGRPGESIDVQFNPVSLQLLISNTLREQGRGNERKQYVTKSSAKLSMDLMFDSTNSGSDVRIKTEKFADLMAPQGEGNNKTPTVILFEWGTFRFQGFVESYRETLDYFAANGIPLRASMNLTLASQERVFENRTTSNDDTQEQDEPIITLNADGESVTTLATRGGDPAASRAIGTANNLDSLRFPSGALAVDPSINLRPPRAFARTPPGGRNLGGESDGTSIRIGVTAELEVGRNNGTNIQASSRLSAGVSAREGAFSRLRRPSSNRTLPTRLKGQQLYLSGEEIGLNTELGANFHLGGRATNEGSLGLQADVGAKASLRSRIQFQEV